MFINIFMIKKSIGKFLRFYVALKFRNANLTVRGDKMEHIILILVLMYLLKHENSD